MKELQNRPITIWKRKQSLGLRFLIYSMIDVPVKVSGITSLRKGDGLLFSILGSRNLNHVGVYVGSGYFIHHLYNGMSKCESLDARWFNRISLVVRHPDITRINDNRIGTVSLLDLLPPHLRDKVKENASKDI